MLYQVIFCMLDCWWEGHTELASKDNAYLRLGSQLHRVDGSFHWSWICFLHFSRASLW